MTKSSEPPPAYLKHSSKPLSEAYDALLLDLDGTTYLGKVAAPYAPEALAAAKSRGAACIYLTNNSGRSPQVVAAHLSEIAIPTEPSEVMNASQVAERHARTILPAGAKVLLVGGEGLRKAFANSIFEVVESADDCPDAVVQGLNEAATWADLSEAVLAIHRGAIHIATNMDATIPKERGPMVGNGSFVACVSNATGSKPINCGKPEPLMFQMGAERVGASHPLAIGDRLNTDFQGAVAAGIDSFHVLTGISQAREILLAAPNERPSYLGIDLREVNQPHPAVTRHLARMPLSELDPMPTWRCGAWQASVMPVTQPAVAYPADSALIIEHVGDDDPKAILLSPRPRKPGKNATDAAGVTLALNAYRAAACAMWEAADTGLIDRERVALPEINVVRESE